MFALGEETMIVV